MSEPLPATALRRACEAGDFPFETTRELEPSAEPLGQGRAVKALALAIGVSQEGYNAFVLGPSGVGKRTTVEALLRAAAKDREKPPDWCYVNNFAESRRPIALELPPGRAVALRKDMESWVAELRSAIPAAFESDEYRARQEAIDSEYQERQSEAFERLGEDASKNGIALVRTPAGFSFAPLAEREVMTPEAYGKLPEAEQRSITERIQKYQAELERIIRQAMDWRRERMDRIHALNREVTEFAVARQTEEIRGRYADLPKVVAFIDAARADVIERADDFRKPPEGPQMMIPGVAAMREPPDFRRYQVNVIVEHDEASGAPVIVEDHPTYANLVGRVEHLSQLGTLVTDFALIRSGALHRANGGYLLLDAHKLLTQPYAWEGLKRALTARCLRIESLGQVYGLINTVSIEPDPIPCTAKVVLFGEPAIYHLLSAYDPEFAALFKVAAEFTDEMDWNEHAKLPLARLVAAIAHERGLRPLGRDAVAAVFERCARLADDAAKLSIHRQSINELLVEADYHARQAGREVIGARDVRDAVRAAHDRSSLIEERLREGIQRDIIMIDTTGAVVGQINALSVYQIGRARFAQPSRVTATTRLGKGELIDIHREVDLGGKIHSKGVLTLAAFLATRFSRLRALALAASLTFEQTYGLVEGDSASMAELCALVSSLADAPLRQDLAITGSVNQLGHAQAIGGVNEKIEGFFDLCRARGLTGRQGVIIPEANRQHLMLRDDVIEAAAAGQFHVYPVSHVDQAIELLTGLPAGEEDNRGQFPTRSVNGMVAARLAQFHALAQPPVPRPAARGRERGRAKLQ